MKAWPCLLGTWPLLTKKNFLTRAAGGGNKVQVGGSLKKACEEEGPFFFLKTPSLLPYGGGSRRRPETNKRPQRVGSAKEVMSMIDAVGVGKASGNVPHSPHDPRRGKLSERATRQRRVTSITGQGAFRSGIGRRRRDRDPISKKRTLTRPLGTLSRQGRGGQIYVEFLRAKE